VRRVRRRPASKDGPSVSVRSAEGEETWRRDAAHHQRGNEARKPDPALLKAFARARGWFEELASGRVSSLVEIARREGLAKRYVTGLAKLAFVSPTFAEAIAEGAVPTSTNLQMLMDGRVALPLSWNEQEHLFTD
jgi:hypothetical protein